MNKEYFDNENEIEQAVKLLNTGAYYEPECIYFVIDTPEEILPQALPKDIKYYKLVKNPTDIPRNGPMIIVDNSEWSKELLQELHKQEEEQEW